MKRVAIVARLKEGGGPRAAQLIAGGPLSDLAEISVASHRVDLSAGEVVFVLDGERFGWHADGCEPAVERMTGSKRWA